MIDRLVVRIKRGDSPVFRLIKRTYRAYNTGHIPVPRFLKPLGSALYHLHFFVFWTVLRRLGTLLYWEPLFRSRCASVGSRLYLERMPEALGHTEIHIGDDVRVHGKIGVYSGRVFDNPVLRIGNRVSIGNLCSFSCNREIVIEDDVLIAARCTFADNDGHPLEADLRAAGEPAPANKTRPVRICRYAWIGAGAYVLKGVTVGEGGIVAAGSVVSADVPPYTVVAGNPARVVKELGRPGPVSEVFDRSSAS